MLVVGVGDGVVDGHVVVRDRPLDRPPVLSRPMSTVRTTARRARRSLRMGAAALVSRSGGAVDRRRALGALVAVLVLGILGMHVLASDDTPANANSSSGITTMMGTEGRMAGGGAAGQPGDSFQAPVNQTDEAGVQAGTAPGNTFGRPWTHGPGSGHGPDGGMSMLMLCAFILTVALTLLVLAVVGIRRLRLPAAFWPAGARDKILGWARGTGPPHEWRFSVIRC
jgi:hypothetical protein